VGVTPKILLLKRQIVKSLVPQSRRFENPETLRCAGGFSEFQPFRSLSVNVKCLSTELRKSKGGTRGNDSYRGTPSGVPLCRAAYGGFSRRYCEGKTGLSFLSEAKDLLLAAKSRSFASLRMTILAIG
jgi:hypothetical protein